MGAENRRRDVQRGDQVIPKIVFVKPHEPLTKEMRRKLKKRIEKQLGSDDIRVVVVPFGTEYHVVDL